MAKACRCCTDRRREEIDRELASGRSVPEISREFGLPESNLYRHRKDHMTLTRSITESRPAALSATVEHLCAIDEQLKEVQAMALRRGNSASCVAALAQRIKVAVELAELRDELKPKEKRVIHVHISQEEAERIARSYTKHHELLGSVIDGKVQ